jgi:phosphoribosylcarboxyaminoimidazole (NCAIR) mutase
MLSIADPALLEKLDAYRQRMAAEVEARDSELQVRLQSAHAEH